MHTIEYVRTVLVRDLEALKREITAYPTDADVWTVPPGTQNSAGTLALHLAGNLRHFIGARLGATGYVRDRPAEFSRRGVPRSELASEIDRAIIDVRETLQRLDADRLEDPFPDVVAGVRVTVCDFLTHLAAHTGYHLGQVDYHRRIVTGSGTTVGAMAVPELASAEGAT
jgi:uncharacterized damage-inducible protein DinB